MKFKGYICLLVAFFLLVSNMGLAFNIRYCDDEITSVTLKTPIQDQKLEKYCCGVVEIKSHCCKNKEIKFQKKTDNLIQKIISIKLAENQLDESGLTIGDLEVIKTSFKEVLLSSLHQRPKYPKPEDTKALEAKNKKPKSIK